MGEPALDYHVCYKGFYLGIEAKKPGGLPTSRQIQTLQKIHKAGGAVFVIDGTPRQDLDQLIGWLMSPSAGFVSLSAQRFIANHYFAVGDPKDE